MLALASTLLLCGAAPSAWMAGLDGPLQDAQCNLETVEAAKCAHHSRPAHVYRELFGAPCGVIAATCVCRGARARSAQQLHAVLSELSETPFFRLINVNMDGKCQYWGGPEEEEPACESRAEPSAPPLCSLGTDASADPFGAPTDPFGGGGGGGFSSPADAAFSSPVDATITPEEDRALAGVAATAEDCSNEELPTFWLDMCSNIPTNASDYVNLQLNPESYTGYNGSHVWAAIYEENCLSRTGGASPAACARARARTLCLAPCLRSVVRAAARALTDAALAPARAAPLARAR